jgi:prolipoprotein diacylglyceryltransferase
MIMLQQTKTITIEENEENDQTTVIVEQTTVPEESLEIGGVKLTTDLHWYGNAFVLLLLVALLYIGKKTIDKWFEKKNKEQG